MKTRINTLISIAVLPFVLFSCNKTAESVDSLSGPMVTIQASIPVNQTSKVVGTVPASGTGMDWSWEAGDKIAIIAGEANSVFDIRPGFEANNASFIGKQITGDKYSIVYPGTYTSEAALQALTFSEQQQVGNDKMEHIKYFAILSGVDAYDAFTFSNEWAGAHGGALKQCGVLCFKLTLPEETTVVNRITLKAGSPIFHNGNSEDALSDELTIGLSECALGADKTVIAWMNTSWFDDVIPANTALSVNVAAGDFSWVRDITSDTEKTVKSGFVNKLTLDNSAWVSGGRYADGEGTQENPWQIKTATQLTYMRDDMVSREMRYFKLIADIDLAGIEWEPLNSIADASDETKSYDKFIDFDGAGHTIYNLTTREGASYPSFAGVLYGTIKNVTFVDAKIAGGANKTGVVAGYMGTSQNFTDNVISNVVVKNATVSASRHVGSLVGQVATGNNTITDCHVLGGTVEGAEYSSGFAGYIQNATVSHCSSSASASGTKHVGGFVGKTEKAAFVDCHYSGASLGISASGNNQSAGFVGYSAAVSNIGSTYTECSVTGTTITATAGQRIGGFVGQTDTGNIFTKCTVKDVDITAALNSAGFVGVDYSNKSGAVTGEGIFLCKVEGGSITAKGNQVGGFVAYPENATIKNCYSTMDVNGGTYTVIGGFVGQAQGNAIVQYCYASGNVQGGSPVGAFVGKVNVKTAAINNCIAWNNTLPFAGLNSIGGDVSNNYCGTEGTIAGHAVDLGWDPAIWGFAPTLKSRLILR